LYGAYTSEAGAPVGPEITVDGTEALDAADAYYDGGGTELPGYQGISLSDSFSNGALTIHEDDPLLFCTPNCSSPTSYTSAGVELERTWQTADDGTLAFQTDVFQSTNGAQHTLAVEEDDEIAADGPGPAEDFPGTAGFQSYTDTSTVTLPAGPGAIYYKVDSATPAAGDGTNPQGAIVYATAPNSPVAFTEAAASGRDYDEWVMPYTRTIPAGGTVALRFAYDQAFSLTTAQSLAASALATFPPAVTITSPANGSTVTTPAVAVSGTVSDAAGISSLKVNGVTATIASGGTFTAAVPLAAGANTITATAVDNDGITGTAAVSVTYHNPPVVTTGKASKVSSSSAKISGTVNPEGQATTYAVQYGKTTAYGSTSTAASAGTGSAALTVTATISALKANTTYHYRVIATNAGGTTYGTDATFKTAKPSPKGLGTKVSPSTADSFPYHYTVKGKLSRPSGITTKQGCSGKITIKIKHGSKTVSTGHAKIGKKCTWSTTLTVSKVNGTGKLKITPSFGGNSTLAALTGKSTTVHYG
jgi:alkylated DNA nucleotide flippase Atl1